MNEAKKIELFKAFLSTNDILIADKMSASRRRLVKTLVDMGAKRARIESVSHYSEAVDFIKTKKPKLILSDFTINGGAGFDLFKEYRENYPDEKKSTLILVTSNISQSAVAKAAEEDVDSFIIKPYTAKSLEKSLLNTVIDKLYPSKYVQIIEQGKEKLFNGDYQEALEIFEKAKQLSKKPSLAYFYHGQTTYMLESFSDSENDYKKGLEINSIHFKCQIGLYDLFMKNNDHLQAYDVVKNIAKYFPANPDRLKEVVRLAIMTKNYTDIEDFYEIFKSLDEREEDVVNYICAGLYICGKFYFLNNQLKEGRKSFEKVGISCLGKGKFLKQMIKILVQYEFFDDAQKLLVRFPSGGGDQEDYLISTYLSESNQLNPTEKTSRGLDLYNKGIRDPECVRIMIDSLTLLGSDKKARNYLEEAVHLWPDLFKQSAMKAA